LIIPAQSSSNN